MEGTRDGRSWRSLYEGRAAKVWSGRTWLAAACCCALVGLPLLVGDVRVARAAGSGYAAAVLADHPVGYWRFGEAAGASTAVDASGHGINGTYVGGPTLAVAGALSGDTDTAVRFNGAAGQYVSFGNNFGMAATQPFSVEVWVRPDSIPSATFAVLAEKFNAGTPQT